MCVYVYIYVCLYIDPCTYMYTCMCVYVYTYVWWPLFEALMQLPLASGSLRCSERRSRRPHKNPGLPTADHSGLFVGS